MDLLLTEPADKIAHEELTTNEWNSKAQLRSRFPSDYGKR
jgi:hypothetical protein